MTAKTALFLLLGIDAVLLLFSASSLSLTYHGAKLLYADDPGLMALIVRGSLALFGQNDVALRLPMIMMNLVSAILLYAVAAPYAKRDRERLWLIAIFLLLPGIISASLLVDGAALTVLGLFGYFYLYQRQGHRADLLLPLMLWADPAFMLLFFGLAVHAVRVKTWRYLLLYALLFAAALWIYGFNTGGLPENRFLDTIGLYAAVLSPFVFVYMIYVLYRRYVTKRTDIIWSVSAAVFLLSVALSFRQRIGIEFFAPYLMVALPLGMQTFYRSYRIRLRPFRKRYRLLFTLAFIFLIFNASAVFLNKAAYPFLKEPERYFAYKTHIAKELASALKAWGIHCAELDDRSMQLRLRFYGVESCNKAFVSSHPDEGAANVTIRYFDTPVAKYYVTKLPKGKFQKQR